LKYFMSDIHGEFNGLEQLLKYAEIDLTKDQLVFGGDYINRGKESGKVLRKIKQLVDTYPNNVIALIGNHEEMMRDYYQHGDKLWLRHGGIDTLKDFSRAFADESEMHKYIEWACGLPLLYEDDEFVYTHAGLNPHEPLYQQNRGILWMSESDFYSIPKSILQRLTDNKPIVHGHTPVERIYFDGVRLNCDMGSNTYSIKDERGLGLVNVSEMIYIVYKTALKKMETRNVNRM